MRILLVLLAASATVSAASPLDQSGALAAERFKVTSDFAKAQTALRESKDQAGKDRAMSQLEDISAKTDSILSRLTEANVSVIRALDCPTDNIYGSYDPSATISATVTKLTRDNQVLSAIRLPTSAPFSPADINAIQVALDRAKKSIEEHRHACANLETTITQRRRKPIEPPKNYPNSTGLPYRPIR